MAEEFELEDSLTPPEVGKSLQNPEAVPSSEEQIALLKKTNQGLYERLKKAEVELKGKKGETVLPPQEPASDDKWKRRMEFIIENRELTSQEANDIMAYAEGKGISYEDALKSEFTSLALESMRAKRKSEQKTPAPSSQTNSGVLPEKPTEQMSKSERVGHFEKLIDARRGKQGFE